MHKLELKVPPPVVALLIAAAMWGLAWLVPPAAPPTSLRMFIAIAFACIGIGIDIAGAVAFRRARTTINPLKPNATSALVTTGVYRFTRNPMYVGLAVALFAWAIWLASLPALLGLPAFVFYIGRFQIAPEERALARIFGEAFADYQSKVRRWL